MKSTCLLFSLLLCLGPSLVSAAPADQASVNKSAAPTAPDAAWLAQAKAAYPLTTCVVSDEDFGGSMGEPIDYVYRQAGKPDRLVRFCCQNCIKDFTKDPNPYLKLIDEAAAKVKKN